MQTQKPRPFGRCTACKAPDYGTEFNRNCGRMVGGKRCKGTVLSALTPTDWVVCDRCNGTGVDGQTPCIRCDATGWLYARTS